nr:DMT family transporter [Kibdelosporangium sp. MJ126-NF4]CEL14641.1 Permease of the drug/metabolite transporter (DMT) superfamily [Kibdelosporangium sp. MJ126-NF4]CTQ96730.1 Permease of the drug/metabolite transporter (DMT) superfamily [Kibdelosporangium sp. MJ126-NF4]
MTDRGRWRDGLILGCLGVVCFSGTPPATRVAAPVFGAATLTLSRVLVAAILGVITLLVSRRLRWPGRRYVPGLLVMGLGLAGGYPLFLALAVQRVPASHSAVVIGLVPAATGVLAAIRIGERQRARFWAACLIGFAAVLTFALTQGGGKLDAADLWLVAAVLSCGIGYVEGAKVARDIGAVPTLCWAMILLAPAAAIALVAAAPLPPASSVPAGAWIGFGYACLVSMFVGSVLWYRGLAAGGTARIGQLNLAQPFLAIAWSGLLLHERITWAVAVTAAVIVVCMTVCVRSPSAPRLPTGRIQGRGCPVVLTNVSELMRTTGEDGQQPRQGYS